METKINEIFSSIQGEGLWVGCKQIFIRFCGCNLNCAYCDTEFKNGKTYTPQELYEKITKEYDINTVHSIALTGGEPLLFADFLAQFLPKIKNLTKIYLETNATLSEEFLKIKNYVDIVSADIKLPSSSRNSTFELHEKFFKNCKGIETFAKVVFDENITDEEIARCAKIAQTYNLELVLQPKTTGNNTPANPDFYQKTLDKFCKLHKNTRLIPQVHKFICLK